MGQQKLFLANIDTIEEFNDAGKDYNESPEYIDECSKNTIDSVQRDPVILLH